MALKKEKTVKGYTAEYWKITWVKLDTMSYTISCELCLYKDMSTRQLGRKNMVEREIFSWPQSTSSLAEFAALTTLESFEWAYNKIVESELDENGAETNFLVDAVSILETV